MNRRWIDRHLARLLALCLLMTMLPAGLAEGEGIELPPEEVTFELTGDEAVEVAEDPEDSEPPAEVLSEAAAELSDEVSLEASEEVPAEAAGEAESESSQEGEASLGLSLDLTEVTLGVGDTRQLEAAVDGQAASEVTWSSDDERIVKVTKAGKLTAKKVGFATITARWGDAAATCAVTVIKAPTKVTLSQTKATLGAGQTLQLSADITEGTLSAITWKSGKPSVASVDSEGLVTALAAGSATITASAYNGKKATCKLTVVAEPTGIAFADAHLTVLAEQVWTPGVAVEGGSFDCDLTVIGDAVAVEGNQLRAIKAGAAIVTATLYNGLKASQNITVLSAPTQMSLPEGTLELGVKDTVLLSPVFDVAAPVPFTCVSSAPKVVAVSAGGELTAKKVGEATITLTAYNGLTATCPVQVFKAPSKVILSQKALTLGEGESEALTASIAEDTRSGLTWKSNHPEIAAVDQAGQVTGLQKGKATITVATANGRKATCTVSVVAVPTEIAFDREWLDITLKATGELTWTTDVADAGVTLSIEDEAIVKIKKQTTGKVTLTARAEGTTKLTATTINGLTATATVNVLPLPTYLDLPEASVSLRAGQTYAIEPDTDALELTYSTNKKAVATVSADGLVTALKPGTATITVKTTNGLSAKLALTVTDEPTAITITPAKLTLEPYEYRLLTVTPNQGTLGAVTFASSAPRIAFVSEDGVVTGIAGGQAIITATAGGLSATCTVTVVAPVTAPASPDQLSLWAVNATILQASWSEVSGAEGYNVYLGKSDDFDESTLYGTYSGTTTQASLRGVTPGTAWHVFVTAYSDAGESATPAHAQVTTPSTVSAYTVALNYSDSLMLSVGSEKALAATISPSGYTGQVIWESNAQAVALSDATSEGCTLCAQSVGSAQVTVLLENGMSASVNVQVVDPTDTSEANFSRVQKAILKNEALMEEDAGGNVIWDMIYNNLVNSNIPAESVSVLVGKLKTAEELFRNIYVYSVAAYDIVGQATRDKRGSTVSVSSFIMRDNTLYLAKSSATSSTYTYTAMHETGHAIDFNADEKQGLLSENDEATAAVTQDVRALLLDRVDEAADQAGVSLTAAQGEEVVDAIMDYRTLLNEEEALAGLSAKQKLVYTALTELMASEMNSTLPMNNGTMVWDAVEGATNFAVKPMYGHAYLLESSLYKDQASYYYYDKSGNATITAEPWAEFFSANIMQDAATLAVNLAYLPRTCQYFAETLAPAILSAFKSLVKGK